MSYLFESMVSSASASRDVKILKSRVMAVASPEIFYDQKNYIYYYLASASTTDVSSPMLCYPKFQGKVFWSNQKCFPTQAPTLSFQLSMTPEYRAFICNNTEYMQFTKLLTQFLRTEFSVSLTPPHPRAIQFVVYQHPEDGIDIPMVKVSYLVEINEVQLIKAFTSLFTHFLAGKTKTLEEYNRLEKLYRKVWIIFREE